MVSPFCAQTCAWKMNGRKMLGRQREERGFGNNMEMLTDVKGSGSFKRIVALMTYKLGVHRFEFAFSPLRW